jgi:hypothetical protein
MKIQIPADYLYKGAPAQTLEVSKEILQIDPATAWDEHIKRETARIEAESKE